ncbi:putative polyprotein [Panicum miliaceum]|uniref:Polyprotein n=1 Tax=Panicum miliaceum TaxID=4540 RepID=A0A3L6QD94_PANMI|nr:putative polyprotein [Panicum miliaceum]
MDSWEDLKRAFIDNFQGSMIRVGTRHDLSQVKQEMNETLRSYTWCFFEMHATIANITDEDVISLICHENISMAYITEQREYLVNEAMILELQVVLLFPPFRNKIYFDHGKFKLYKL